MYRYHAPLDPNCREVRKFNIAIYSDPMTKAYGAPIEDFMERFENNHRRKCKRCQEYGAANIEVTD